MSTPSFSRVLIGSIDNSDHTGMNTLITTGDLNNNGRVDVIVAGRSGHMVWFENIGNRAANWTRHAIAAVSNVECGGITYDLSGNGYRDVINGGDGSSDALAWWANPGAAGGEWTRHVITKTGYRQFHDERIGDVTGEGRNSLVFWNNGDGALCWVPLPDDPSVSPWPGVQIIARDLRSGSGRWSEEGLALADLDGDGVHEIIAGTHWYKYAGTGNHWEQHQFAGGYISTVVALADLDGDGQLEILLSEGDANLYAKRLGKAAWFKRSSDITALWDEHLLADDLLEPHTLQAGDITGNGHPDIVVGEIGIRDRLKSDPPRLLVYANQGDGTFTPHLIDAGTGNHHAHLLDLDGDGKLDIVSRPLLGPDRWNVYAWYNDTP